MKTPLKRIRLGAIVLVVILLVAIGGYRYSGRTWIQSFYMVVITISGIGYDDEPSTLSSRQQLFTVAVIVFGMSAAGYTVGGLIQMMTEGEIQRAMGHRWMPRGIQQLKDQLIICGYGRIGQILAQEFHRQKPAPSRWSG